MSDYDPNEDDDSLEFINEEVAKLKSQKSTDPSPTLKINIIDDDNDDADESTKWPDYHPGDVVGSKTAVHIVDDDDTNPPQVPKVTIIKDNDKMPLIITIDDLFDYARTLQDYYADDEQKKESVYSCTKLLNAKYPPNCGRRCSYDKITDDLYKYIQQTTPFGVIEKTAHGDCSKVAMWNPEKAYYIPLSTESIRRLMCEINKKAYNALDVLTRARPGDKCPRAVRIYDYYLERKGIENKR